MKILFFLIGFFLAAQEAPEIKIEITESDEQALRRIDDLQDEFTGWKFYTQKDIDSFMEDEMQKKIQAWIEADND